MNVCQHKNLHVCDVLILGRILNSEETDELIAAAAFMHVRREELSRQFLNQDRWAYQSSILHMPSSDKMAEKSTVAKLKEDCFNFNVWYLEIH